jgi:hypothetical protein
VRRAAPVLVPLLLVALCLAGPARGQEAGPAYGGEAITAAPSVYDEAGLAQAEENAGYMERLTAGLVLALPNFLVRALHLQDPVVLVFQEIPPDIRDEFRPGRWVPPEDMIWYTFTEAEFGAVDRIYTTLEKYLPVSLTLMLIFAAAVLYAAGFSAERRSSAKSALLGLVVALAAMRLGPYLMGLAFDLNRALVLVFREAMGADSASFLNLLWRPETRSLGMALVVFVAAMSVGVLNWQYVIRKLTLGILIFSFPLVCVLAVVPSRRGALQIWFREFTANVFLQSAHAAVYAFFVLFIKGAWASGQFGAFWVSIAFLLGLDGLSEVLRRLVGAQTLSGTGAGLIGGALGLGSVFALGRLAFAGLRGGGPGVSGGLASGTSGPGGLAGALAAGAPEAPAPAPGYRLGAAALRFAGGAAAFGAATAGMMAGAMIGGAAAGKADLGAGFGLAGGTALGARIWKESGEAAQTLTAVGREAAAGGVGLAEAARRTLGLYGGQLYRPAEAARAGRALAGTPGAVAGWALAQGARAAGALQVGAGAEAGWRASRGVDRMVRAWQAELARARQAQAEIMPQYELAKENLNFAKARYGTDSQEYWQARGEYDAAAARLAEAKAREIEARQHLSYPELRAQYDRLRAVSIRVLSGTTADEGAGA